MKSIKRIALTSALFFSVTTLNAYAALYDRGNGMIYDSDQNLTWLQDTNYAKTSGYDTDGLMQWSQANTWANNLTYGGYSDWRLPSAKINGTNVVCTSSYSSCPGYYDGTYDASFNNTRSEVGHLYFELGNIADYNSSGIRTPLNNGFVNVGPFTNIKNSAAYFWESEQYLILGNGGGYYPWVFNASIGRQLDTNSTAYNFAWAVRDGDVAAVPVPATAWLFGSGLFGLTSLVRKRKAV